MAQRLAKCDGVWDICPPDICLPDTRPALNYPPLHGPDTNRTLNPNPKSLLKLTHRG